MSRMNAEDESVLSRGCDACLLGTDMHAFSLRACWGAFSLSLLFPVLPLAVGLSGKGAGFSPLNRLSLSTTNKPFFVSYSVV